MVFYPRGDSGTGILVIGRYKYLLGFEIDYLVGIRVVRKFLVDFVGVQWNPSRNEVSANWENVFI